MTELLSICIVHCARSVLVVDGRRLELFANCIRSLGAASVESGVPAELVIADWSEVPHEAPLCDWLWQASTLPVRIVMMDGEFSKGRGCNAAACASQSDMLFFCDADMIVSAGLLRRGVDYLAAGKAWFPGYLAEQGAGGSYQPPKSPGTGNAFMTREQWKLFGGWPEQTTWGNFDRPVSKWFEKHGLSAEVIAEREAVQGFVHQWHPKYQGWPKDENR